MYKLKASAVNTMKALSPSAAIMKYDEVTSLLERVKPINLNLAESMYITNDLWINQPYEVFFYSSAQWFGPIIVGITYVFIGIILMIYPEASIHYVMNQVADENDVINERIFAGTMIATGALLFLSS